MTDVEIDLVLPCLNEAGALPWVMERIPAGVRAIVVDNGSDDGSPELARSLGATVVTATRRGYGAACLAGTQAADADLIAFCDCDASLDPAAVLELAAVLRDGDTNLVLGRRRPVTARAWPAPARVANWELARRVRRATGLDVRDIGPLRLARRADYVRLAVTDQGFGYPVQTLVLAARAGWSVRELDVDYHPRVGRSKVTGTVSGSIRAVRDISAVLAA